MSISFAQYEKTAQQGSQRPVASSGPRVRFFSLKNDGDEALVRFLVDKKDDIEVVRTHQQMINGYSRRVECIRDVNEPVDNCPFCSAGRPIQTKVYIKLIEYIRDDAGVIQPVAKVWERPVGFGSTISNYLTEYGPLSDMIFKVKRKGAAGSTNTTYDILYASPSIYPVQNYPKSVELFEGYNVVGGAVISKDFQGMLECLSDTETSGPSVNNYSGPTGVARPAARTYAPTFPVGGAGMSGSSAPGMVTPSTSYSAPNAARSVEPSTPSVTGPTTPVEENVVSRPRRFY